MVLTCSLSGPNSCSPGPAWSLRLHLQDGDSGWPQRAWAWRLSPPAPPPPPHPAPAEAPPHTNRPKTNDPQGVKGEQRPKTCCQASCAVMWDVPRQLWAATVEAPGMGGTGGEGRAFRHLATWGPRATSQAGTRCPPVSAHVHREGDHRPVQASLLWTLHRGWRLTVFLINNPSGEVKATRRGPSRCPTGK